MANVNKVILLGRLGKDPDVRTFQDGGKIASFTLATSERYKDKNGETREATEWHNVVASGKVADIVEAYAAKGDQLYVEGKLRTRSWEDQYGAKKYTTEIVCLGVQLFSPGRRQESAPEASRQDGRAYGDSAGRAQASSGRAVRDPFPENEDLPF